MLLQCKSRGMLESAEGLLQPAEDCGSAQGVDTQAADTSIDPEFGQKAA